MPAPALRQRPAREFQGRDWLAVVLLFSLTAFTFLPTIHCGFVNFDDYAVVGNPRVLAGMTWKGAAWAFSNIEQCFYFPLTWLSLQLDAQLYGQSPWGYHLTNTLFHAASAAVLFSFLRLATGSWWRSVVAAALFAIHPLRVESVAWVTERKDVLGVFFGLLSLVAYVQYTRRPGKGRFAWVVALYCMSLLSKATLVTLPALFLVLDFWPLGRVKRADRTLRRFILEKVPLTVPAVAIAAATFFGQKRVGVVQSMDEIGIAQRLANVCLSYVRYIEKTVCFSDLANYYPWRPVPAGTAGLAAAGILLITALAICFRRKRPWLIAGWLWYLGTLVPMIGLVAIGGIAMADRYSYFPCIGLSIMVLWSVPDPSTAVLRITYSSAVAAACMLLATATFTQIEYWKDSASLWERDLAAAGESALAQGVYGDFLLQQGFPRAAAQHLKAAVRLAPTYFSFHADLASALYFCGDLRGAVDEGRHAVRLKPTEKGPYFDLAEALAAQGQRTEAIECYRKALQIDPGYVNAQRGMASLLQGSQAAQTQPSR